MLLTFLTGQLPMTKTITFSQRDEHYTTTPYPLLRRVSSSVRAALDMTEFQEHLNWAVARSACLLKGSLDLPLNNESRAGHALDIEHEWVVFDFDGVDCSPDLAGAEEAVTKYLPRSVADCDYVVQLSASTFRPDARRLSAHVFMSLGQSMTTEHLTHWLTWINFHSPLKDEIRLSDSGMALHLPLDRTVSSPSKLIYITPPQCLGFTPRHTESIHLHHGVKRSIPPSAIPALATLQKAAGEVLGTTTQLRERAGLPNLTLKTRLMRGLEVLDHADTCVVHDLKPSGDGYLRFNLNGGDSHAYFVNVREPSLIHNFKGEPLLRTAQVAPDFHKSLLKNLKSLPAVLPPAGVEPMAFYATNRQSTVFIGTYDRTTDQLRVDASTVNAAGSWMAKFGVPRTPYLPHYDLVYDMNSNVRFEDGYPQINLYRQTEFMQKFAEQERSLPCDPASLDPIKVKCPLLWRVMYSALGDNETATLHFMNWLAAIFQRRERTQSAWILHGVQGTGKGLFIHYVIRPLFGDSALHQTLFQLLGTEFNAYLEGKLFVVFNETSLPKSNSDWNVLRAKLYDWITEPSVVIHAKGKDPREAPNHSNFILCSNDARPVMIEDGDRRFNVGEFQSTRLFVTSNDLATLEEQVELPDFAKMLGSWQVNDEMLVRPYGGIAKGRVIDATHSLVDSIGRAIKNGDARFFVENRPDTMQLRTDFAGKIFPIREYDELLHFMAKGKLNVLTPTDLYVLFKVVALNDKHFPESRAHQRRLYRRYDLLNNEVIKNQRTGKATRGWKCPDWDMDGDLQDEINELTQEKDNGNVLPLRRKKE